MKIFQRDGKGELLKIDLNCIYNLYAFLKFFNKIKYSPVKLVTQVVCQYSDKDKKPSVTFLMLHLVHGYSASFVNNTILPNFHFVRYLDSVSCTYT